MSETEDHEPRSLAESEWQTMPLWVRRITTLVGTPIFLAFMYLIATGEALENEALGIALFTGLGVIAALQGFFVARAYWRMDI